MELVVQRIAQKQTYTIGRLYVDGEKYCDTLEDKVRDINRNGVFDNGEKKVYGETAIPFGKYEIKMTFSPKFSQKSAYKFNICSVLSSASSAVACAVCPSCHKNSLERRNGLVSFSHLTTEHHWLYTFGRSL